MAYDAWTRRREAASFFASVATGVGFLAAGAGILFGAGGAVRSYLASHDDVVRNACLNEFRTELLSELVSAQSNYSRYVNAKVNIHNSKEELDGNKEKIAEAKKKREEYWGRALSHEERAEAIQEKFTLDGRCTKLGD